MAETTETQRPSEGLEDTVKSFGDWSGEMVSNDPRMTQLAGIEEPSETDQLNLRQTRTEIQVEMRDRIDEFKTLNPDASDGQAQDYVQAMYANDLGTVDRVNKEVEKTRAEKEKESGNAAKRSVDLQTRDTAAGSDEAGEDLFTGKGAWGRAKQMLGLPG